MVLHHSVLNSNESQMHTFMTAGMVDNYLAIKGQSNLSNMSSFKALQMVVYMYMHLQRLTKARCLFLCVSSNLYLTLGGIPSCLCHEILQAFRC